MLLLRESLLLHHMIHLAHEPLQLFPQSLCLTSLFQIFRLLLRVRQFFNHFHFLLGFLDCHTEQLEVCSENLILCFDLQSLHLLIQLALEYTILLLQEV